MRTSTEIRPGISASQKTSPEIIIQYRHQPDREQRAGEAADRVQ
jgi:hypothetical protein